MKDLLLYIARNLVDHPDQVSVTEVQGDGELTLELRVAPDDMGKVIGYCIEYWDDGELNYKRFYAN